MPDNFIPAIKKGFNNSLEKGCLTGNKVTGLKFKLQDGKIFSLETQILEIFILILHELKKVPITWPIHLSFHLF